MFRLHSSQRIITDKIIIHIPDVGKDLISAEHLPLVEHQGKQQAAFHGGQKDLLIILNTFAWLATIRIPP
ncbi:MAG: hypothetical protein ABFD29_09590 [Anaerolineaceae bacterium]